MVVDRASITYRFLEPDEYDRLLNVMPNDEWIPNPQVSKVLVAEKDGNICGFLVCQLCLHVEPMMIKADLGPSTGYIMWVKMMEELRNNGIETFYTFASNPTIADYLLRLGLKESNEKAFIGDLS